MEEEKEKEEELSLSRKLMVITISTAIAIIIAACPFMLLWNSIMPDVFTLPPISYRQSLQLCGVSFILGRIFRFDLQGFAG